MRAGNVLLKTLQALAGTVEGEIVLDYHHALFFLRETQGSVIGIELDRPAVGMAESGSQSSDLSAQLSEFSVGAFQRGPEGDARESLQPCTLTQSQFGQAVGRVRLRG
jgi:hypothetical protein